MVKRPVSLPQEDEVSVAATALVWVELEKGGVGLIRETADELVSVGSCLNEPSLLGNGEFEFEVVEAFVAKPSLVGNAKLCCEVLAKARLDVDRAWLDVALLDGCDNDDD